MSSDYPQVHERALIMRRADLDFKVFMLELVQKYTITPSEEFMLLASRQFDLAKACVRSEREDQESTQ